MASNLFPQTVDPAASISNDSEMGQRTRAFDWSKSPLGAVQTWPQSLRIAVRIMLDSRYAMWLGWGPEFIFFYNDAYAQMSLGPKHPWALGRPASEVWSEIWSDIGPRANSVVETGKATYDEGLLLFLERQGFPEETYHTFSYSPLPDDQGNVGGMLCVVTEDTERTIGERRLRTLRELAARTTAEARSVEEACETAARIMAENPFDLPFALIYLLDSDEKSVWLAGVSGLVRDSLVAQRYVELDDTRWKWHGWPFLTVLQSGQSELVSDLKERFGDLPGPLWPDPVTNAVILPLKKAGQAQLAGFVIAGLSPRLLWNDAYRGFLDLLSGQVATAITNASAYEEERKRSEALAELDAAKTTFFSNISHEFRTPLTLMLSPIEDLLCRNSADFPNDVKTQLEIVNRNGLRLLRLVDSLLDFSRIEAGRVRAFFQRTDLSNFTTDLASGFRSACERAGLSLQVDCQPITSPAYIDRDMWEKIVLNLLSNAFKFTFKGGISVALKQENNSAELKIQDTGTGIPADEIPLIFNRFHRVENAQGRTHEGSGIGLALVQELVRLHGGHITVESVEGHGTTFTLGIPLGKSHLPGEQVSEESTTISIGFNANPFVEEALRWLPCETVSASQNAISEEIPRGESAVEPSPVDFQKSRPRVLLADDNADMRHYIKRLLSEHFQVTAVADGQAALERAQLELPELVLTDVMMPRLDGFGLLRELRANSKTRGIPVIMLSARAGEESRVVGMEAGADDYLVKPFSGRELLARVTSHLQMARIRQEAGESLRQSEERLRMALAAARMVAWQFDPATDRVVLSDNAAEVFGFLPNFQFDTSAKGFELIHPDDVTEFRATVRRAVDECGSYRTHFRMFRQDTGALIWLEDRGQGICSVKDKSVRLMGVVMDVTDRKIAEEALRASEERFRLLADAAPVLIWQSGIDKRFTWFNRPWLDFVGRKLEREIGDGWVENVHPEDKAKVLETYNAAFDQRTPFSMEFRLKRHDGQYRWLLDNGIPSFGGGDEFIGYLGSSTDIHERKQAEEALMEANSRKDEFLATLAHELRNPLAPIRNCLQLMKMAKGNPDVIEQARVVMERQLGQMVRLIDDLLDVSRISRGKVVLQKSRIPLLLVLQNALETSRPLIDASRHELEVHFPIEAIYVDADETRLSQVFTNLLNNAAKYTERGGHIRFSASREGNDAVVSVRDSGVGIPAPMLPRVFEMFVQVDRSIERSQGGLGIGLTIVKRLVEMHGGSVEALSEGHGRGSEFVVRIPVARNLKTRESIQGPSHPVSPTDRKRILVTDDNIDSALSMSMMLKISGYETQMAHDGLEALEMAEKFRPDVILLDIGMPKMNGYEACRKIREQPWGKEIVLIALTGWGQADDKRQSREAGFNFHLVKPVEPQALETLLANLQIGSK